jgi:aminopeptidase
MLHPLLETYADLLVGYCVRAAPGELVALHVATPALPLARALVRSTLRAGARPALRLTYPEYVEDVLELAHDGFYAAEPELDLEEVRRADGWIRVSTPTNSRALQAVEKARLARLSRDGSSPWRRCGCSARSGSGRSTPPTPPPRTPA